MMLTLVDVVVLLARAATGRRLLGGVLGVLGVLVVVALDLVHTLLDGVHCDGCLSDLRF